MKRAAKHDLKFLDGDSGPHYLNEDGPHWIIYIYSQLGFPALGFPSPVSCSPLIFCPC